MAAGCAGGDGDPLRRDFNLELALVMTRNSFPKRSETERRRISRAAIAHRADAGFDDRLWRRKVGLADLHVHDAAAGALERLRAREHVHHFEGLDLGGAARR